MKKSAMFFSIMVFGIFVSTDVFAVTINGYEFNDDSYILTNKWFPISPGVPLNFNCNGSIGAISPHGPEIIFGVKCIKWKGGSHYWWLAEDTQGNIHVFKHDDGDLIGQVTSKNDIPNFYLPADPIATGSWNWSFNGRTVSYEVLDTNATAEYSGVSYTGCLKIQEGESGEFWQYMYLKDYLGFVAHENPPNDFCIRLTDISDGLIAYYPFNGNANDESGKENNGIVDGATLTKDRYGQKNSAYSFDGNDFIDVGDIYVINNNAVSISLWIKFQDNTNDNQFLTNGSNLDSDPNFFGLTYNNDGSKKIRMVTFDGLSSNFYTKNKYDLNTWYHIVFTRKGGEGKVFINGSLENTDTVQSGDIGDHHSWYIGKGHQGSFFEGVIDEVRIYDRVLSSSEVINLYKFSKSSVTMPCISLLLLADTETPCLSNPYFKFCAGNITNWRHNFYKRKETVKEEIEIEGKNYFVFFNEEERIDDPSDTNSWSHYLRQDCNGNIWFKYEKHDPEVFCFPNISQKPIGYKWCCETSQWRGCYTILDKSESVTVPAGTFTDCIKTHKESWYSGSPNKTVTGHEWFCYNVGSVKETEDDPDEEYPTTDQLTSANICGDIYP